MKKFCFRKILQYDPTYKGKYSKFEGYREIMLQRLDPNIKACQEVEIKISRDLAFPVFVSSSNRGKTTARKYFEFDCIKTFGELREIKLDLKSLLTEKEYVEKGSNLVRARFIEAFGSDSLVEKRDDIHKRIARLLGVFLDLEDGTYLVISHSFFMKIFQSYLTNQDLFSQPSLLKKYFNPNKRTFNFGSGFEFSILSNNKIVVK